MDTLTREQDEARLDRQPMDAISTVVGSRVYSAHHRFEDLRASMYNAEMSAGALSVSRYYFTTTPPVVVDVVRRPARSRAEIDAKRDYCRSKGIRYVLVTDDFDEEAVRSQLTPERVAKPGQPPRTTAKPRKPRTRKT